MPGVYEIGLPNAALASGATAVHLMLYGAANMVPVLIEIELDAVDYQDNVRFGLGSLPNAAAGANGGVPLSNASGNVGSDLQTIKAQAVTAAGAVTVLSSVGTAATSTAQTGNTFGLLNPMISGGAYTAPALANAPSGGGGGGNVTVAGYATGQDPATLLGGQVSTVLARIGTPSAGSVSGDIAALATGNGLFIPGTITAASSASSFTVAFTGSAPAAASLVGLYCCNTSTGHAPAKQAIATATSLDSTHLTLTLSTPFGAAPSVGDAVLVG